ncbi:uncharacterized protein LOC124156024 [Ischnura elegans]|uniref:uncharacterized protein LOC124156024 n=1 Tax=Ischnura elegans TaxID=197161 RepID=UPI001ED86737|nr:uncharacterized protein LOC124156024 [Ischnura elegans]
MIDDRRLIAEIRNHPLLYDPGVPENRDVNAKESTWNYIGKTLGYTVRECKMRWKSLRERFARERKKIIMSSHGEGIGSDDDHEKDGQKAGSWHLMKEMNFLWNFVFHRNMNRSKSMIYLNDDHSNMQIATTSLSAPIWLLPNVTHSNIPQTIQPRPAHHDDTSSDCGEASKGQMKDPLSNDEENSMTFDIGSSDSEEETRSKKRLLDASQSRSTTDTTVLKRVRRDSSGYQSTSAITSTPVTTIITSHQNEATISSGMHSGQNLVIVSTESEKNTFNQSKMIDVDQTMASTSESKDRDNHIADSKVIVASKHNVSPANKCACQCGWKKQTEEELFCSSIAASMQRLTPKQRALLKLQIQKALFEIEYPE